MIFEGNKIKKEDLKPRAIIPNDCKLFAQADLDNSITHFVTSDARSTTTIKMLRAKVGAQFQFIDMSTPYDQTFGILDL